MRRFATLAVILAFASSASAANRLFFDNQTVVRGATGVGILLKADMDQVVYGFSFGVNYDETKLKVTAVSVDGTTIPNGAPDFFDGIIDVPRGLVGWGCVLDFGPTFNDVLPAGTNKAIAKLTVDVIGNAGTTQLSLENVPTNPDPTRPVKNIMTNSQGQSVVPTLAAGTITIQEPENRTPQIITLTGNSGLAGKVFHVTGKFFGEPGLAVKVCSAAAVFTLVDDQNLDVTAPACGSTGFQPIQVTTDRGTDTEANGFNYETEPPPGGLQVPGDCNQDGNLDISDAICLLGHLFLGNPTTVPCTGGTVTDPGNKALLNANGDAGVDLSDAVYDLLFLFGGGPPPVLGTTCTSIEGCPSVCSL